MKDVVLKCCACGFSDFSLKWSTVSSEPNLTLNGYSEEHKFRIRRGAVDLFACPVCSTLRLGNFTPIPEYPVKVCEKVAPVNDPPKVLVTRKETRSALSKFRGKVVTDISMSPSAKGFGFLKFTFTDGTTLKVTPEHYGMNLKAFLSTPTIDTREN